MRSALIGHTGFIGGNLKDQFAFTHFYNSSNIAEIRNETFDLIVCGGVTAVKWWANKNPEEDRSRIDVLIDNLRTTRADRIVVLSSVDVYPVVSGVDESFDCASLPNHAYGTNRLYFENAVKSHFNNTVIARISGVFGPGLKKNVIYDLIHDNCLDAINPNSSFQYYDVKNLWNDLQVLVSGGVTLANLVTEPVRTADVVSAIFPGKQVGAACGPEAHYDIRTRYGTLFNRPDGYLRTSDEVLAGLASFVRS